MSNIATMPTNPKPQTSKEVIAANVQLLIEQLEAGHSEGPTAYLTAMGKFHNEVSLARLAADRLHSVRRRRDQCRQLPGVAQKPGSLP